MRVGLITLGCDKNTVDNEYLAGLLEQRGGEVVFLDDASNLDGIDAVVVTTCGFTCDAKEQSVETLVHIADAKQATGKPLLYVAGCLSQRYAGDLLDELPEIDGLVGVGQFAKLAEMIIGHHKQRNAANIVPLVSIDHYMPRKRSSGKPTAFLKIADGCNHACSFCSIPLMKGPLRSVPTDILLKEARALLESGVKELVLVAQDISVYGRDRKASPSLPDLLRQLCALDGDFWVRCMYCYPNGVTDELMDVMASEPKIVPYLDIPIQHFDRGILRDMKRPAFDLDIAGLVQRLRERVPRIALRTTVIVGYPGETPAAHKRMLEGIEQTRFDWLGAFQYSAEEGTPAATAPKQVGKATMEKRWHAVMQAQAEITQEITHARIGQPTRVLIEDYDAQSQQWLGRSPKEAPEVDGCVYVRSETPLSVGQFVETKIIQSLGYDLIGNANLPIGKS